MAPVRVERGQVLGGRPQHPQRQARPAGRDRRQHRVQSDGELARAEAGQLPVDPRLRLVEATPRRKRQPLRQPAHRGLVGEPDRAAPQTVSVIDPHRIGCRDQYVGGAVRAQQRLQNARPGQFGLQHPQIAQHFGVAEHSAGFGPDRRGDHVGPQRRGLGGQPLADPSISDALMPRSTTGCWLQHRQHPPRRGRQRRPSPQPQPAALEVVRHARLRTHRRQQRQADDLGDIGRAQAAGRRAPHH